MRSCRDDTESENRTGTRGAVVVVVVVVPLSLSLSKTAMHSVRSLVISPLSLTPSRVKYTQIHTHTTRTTVVAVVAVVTAGIHQVYMCMRIVTTVKCNTRSLLNEKFLLHGEKKKE